jgi:hypothetical protein
VLVQAKRLSRDALYPITRNGGAKDAGRDAQTQPRVRFVIGQHGQTEKRIRESLAAAFHVAEFGRLVQSHARLER